MTGKELTKMAKQTIVPYLQGKGFKWVGFDALTYEVFKEEEGLNRYFGSGRYLNRPKGKAIGLPSYKIYNYKFNSALNVVLRKYTLEESRVTFIGYKISTEDLSLRQKMLDHEIYDESTFVFWVDHFKLYWESFVEPFFDKYVLIKEIDNRLSFLGDDWPESLGAYSFLKKLMILKFASNPEYDEYSAWYIQHHESAKTAEGGIYLNYALAALELYERLESGEFDNEIV